MFFVEIGKVFFIYSIFEICIHAVKYYEMRASHKFSYFMLTCAIRYNHVVFDRIWCFVHDNQQIQPNWENPLLDVLILLYVAGADADAVAMNNVHVSKCVYVCMHHNPCEHYKTII